ncbi:MAG: histidine kinase dimerization/phospho-acceptor domain-containing protein [Methylovirgula sp.]|nr:histidine kinase dimerization/phospho-acceptor domain-containing protein [Methylovirgula sp.]
MMAYICEPGVSHEAIETALRALSLRDEAIPFFVAAPDGAGDKIVAASQTMLTLFAAADLAALTARLFAGTDAGAERIGKQARSLALDGAPRLERLSFALKPEAETITVLSRRIADAAHGSLYVAAMLGVGALLARQQAAAGSVRAPESPSAPVLQLDQVRALLGARIGVRTNVRFLWRTDAADKVTEITPPLADVVGAEAADILGRDFGDVAKYLDREPGGPLARAFARHETFSGVEVLWPIAGAAAAVPVGLGGLPAFDRERHFDGYRGFGVIHVDRLAASEPREFLAPEVEETPKPAPTAPEPLALEPELVAAPMPAGEAPRPSPESAPAVPEPVEEEEGLLSQDEATAFRAIGDVLADEVPPPPAAGHEPGAATPVLESNAAAILDRLPLGILVSRDNVAIYANRTLLDLLGFADEDAFHAAGGMARMFNLVPNGSDAIGVRTAAGEILPARARIQAIEWDHLPATLLTLRREDEKVREQTEQLEADLRTQKGEARELSAILDTATDGLVILDHNGRIVTLNRSGEALFGYDQSEVAGQPITVLIAAESQSKVLDYFEGLKANGVASLLNDGREITGRAKQGGLIPIFMTLSRVGPPGSDAAQQKFCALFRDMTHWKKVEEELKQARQEAERASALKSDFLAKVSHEIRTPLNAIMGFAEVILEERFGPIGNERYRDYLRDIHTSGAHVMSLVNDLLDLSKIEAGKMDLQFVSVDVNRAISEAVGIMQPQANQARIIMRLSLAPHLPKIVADERSLRQILLNLLSNAVKFNEPGGQVIISSALTDTGNAVIRIRDTGIGMSEKDIETALEPFRQLATSRQTNGTGLGLPLTKALVEANRAFFTIKSKKDEGTFVEVAFPPARVLAE